MPLLQPYQGDLEQYNPNPSSGFDMKALTDTWMQSRAIKEAKLKQDRDKQILEAIISGQEIPQATPQARPEGFMGRLGEFMTGGRPDVGPSSLETVMAGEAVKSRFLSPTDKLIKEGQAADAQMKIYQAGGPKPSLFDKIPQGQPVSSQQLPLILQNAPQAIQEQATGGPTLTDVNTPTDVEYDQFGRPVKTKVDVLERQKFNVEQKGKEIKAKKETDLLKKSAQHTLNTISQLEKNIKYFGAMGDLPSFPAEYKKKNWVANYNTLKDKLVVDLMLQLKAASQTGSTGFGQLSEKEGMRLENAATALQKGLSEEDAKRYLNEIKDSAVNILNYSENDGGGGKPGFNTKQSAMEELKRRGLIK